MTWKHNIQTVRRKGQVMTRCTPCGQQSGWQNDPEDALAWAVTHVGVKEIKERTRTKNEDGEDDYYRHRSYGG